jgi:four helix bundle protein
MSAGKHRDLEAWQLAHEVRSAILELTSREHVRRDFDFCDQARRAANSACKNTAEGFYRFRHPEFAHFMNIAKGSLGELFDSLDEAQAKRYIDQPEYERLHALMDRAMGAAVELHRHLDTTPTPPRRT